jgi:hypothetical protein
MRFCAAAQLWSLNQIFCSCSAAKKSFTLPGSALVQREENGNGISSIIASLEPAGFGRNGGFGLADVGVTPIGFLAAGFLGDSPAVLFWGAYAAHRIRDAFFPIRP